MSNIRPRAYADETIFESVTKALCKYGYYDLTLARISQEAGVSAAILSKRFGSKKGLLLAYGDYLIRITRQSFTASERADSSAIGALKRVFLEWTAYLGPGQFANLTSFFIGSNGDPELVEKSRRRLSIIDEEVQRLLKAAMSSNEIREAETAKISRVLQAAVTGAFIIWTKDSRLSPEEWLEQCFDVVLAVRQDRSI